MPKRLGTKGRKQPRPALDGERDKGALRPSWDRDHWLIVATILRAIADPAAPAAPRDL